MSEASSVRDRIGKLFSTKLNLDVPSADTDLFETGVLDSLAFVEVLAHLEGEFGVRVSVEELEIENFRSIARIADFIMACNGLMGAGRGGPR